MFVLWGFIVVMVEDMVCKFLVKEYILYWINEKVMLVVLICGLGRYLFFGEMLVLLRFMGYCVLNVWFIIVRFVF